jgi:predicted dehydrogenase
LNAANERIRIAILGLGGRGGDHLKLAAQVPGVEVATFCDPDLTQLQKRGEQFEKLTGKKPAFEQDLRRVFDDKSIDAVTIATCNHWHALAAIWACQAGKHVYVEKPVSHNIWEGRKMVQAARKYKRVVQAGTMQRSAVHFEKAAEIVRSGQLGKVSFVRTWNYGHAEPSGIGNPPDSDPPQGFDWDMWLGPAPKRPFNSNRLGIDPEDKYFSRFRWFWDYAGGMMTDWGIHLLDIVQMAFQETEPAAVAGFGGKLYLQDNRETPDTLQVTYEYPNGMIATYENRETNAQSMFKHGYGILFHGTEGTLFVDRAGYQLVPEKDSSLQAVQVQSSNDALLDHWQNFVDCIKTRKRPHSDIEIGHHSTTTAILGNMAYRSKLRLDWDAQRETTAQPEARPLLKREYRKPWKLEV